MSGGRARLRRWLLPVAIVAALVLAGAVVLILRLPAIASHVAVGQMEKAGLANPSIEVQSLGPFYSGVAHVAFDAGPASVQLDYVGADYSPLRLVSEGRIDALTLRGLDVALDLRGLTLPESDGSPTILFPEALDAIPVDTLLVDGATVHLETDGVLVPLRIDGLVQSSADGTLSASLGLAGGGSDLLLTMDKSGTGGTLQASGTIAPMEWLALLAPVMGVELPADWKIGVAPLELEALADVRDRQPGKWAATVRVPAARARSGALSVDLGDTVLGVTGEGTAPERIILNASISGRYGEWEIAPCSPQVSIQMPGTVDVGVDSLIFNRGPASLHLNGIELGAVRTGTGAITAKLAMEIAGVDLPLKLDVNVSPSMDAATGHISIPTGKLGDALPIAWLPEEYRSLVVSGGLGLEADFEAQRSQDGIAGNALGLLSLQHLVVNPGGDLPVIEDLTAQEVAFTASLEGQSVRLPNGIRAERITLPAMNGLDRAVVLSGLKIGPGAVSLPGTVNVQSAQISLGDLMIAAAPVDFSYANEQLALHQPLGIALEIEDLSSLAASLPMELPVSLSGKAGFTAWLTQDDTSPLPHHLRATATFLAPTLGVGLPGGRTVRIYDSYFDIEAGETLVLKSREPLVVRSITGPGYLYNGEASASGTITVTNLPEVIAGAMPRIDSGIVLSLQGGTAELPTTGLMLDGLTGQFYLEWSDGAYKLSNLQPLQMRRFAIGQFVAENIDAVFDATGEGAHVTPQPKRIFANFFGGEITLESFSGTIDDFRITMRMVDVSSAELAKAFPQFKGTVRGPLSGLLKAHIVRADAGVRVTIYPSVLQLSPGKTGFFSYPNPETLVGQGNMASDRAARSLQSLVLTTLSLRLAAGDGNIMTVSLGGKPTLKDAVEIEAFNINLRGDIVELLETFLGNKGIQLRFDPTGKL